MNVKKMNNACLTKKLYKSILKIKNKKLCGVINEKACYKNGRKGIRTR